MVRAAALASLEGSCEFTRCAGAGAPAYETRSSCWWDGRLDNRKALLALTGLDAGAHDNAILLAIYRQRGVEGLSEAIGDWRAAIWDGPAERLILASDYAGVRPLYYASRAGRIYWSSDPANLAASLGTSRLDDLYVAGFLQRGWAGARTAYEGVAAVPPGHGVIASRNGIAIERFWNPPFGREIQYADERDYEEHFRELFREGVSARMAGESAICAELSGGLDSSSVVAMADRVRRESGASIPLHTFSYTFPDCPDEQYFREMERACHTVGCHLQIGEFPPAATAGAGALPVWWTARYRELARRMKTIGARTLLTGQFGDLITGNVTDDTSQVTEYLANFQFRCAGREAYAWARALRTPIYPILWRAIREACSAWTAPSGARYAAGAIRSSLENSLAPRLAARFAEEEREWVKRSTWRQTPAGKRRRFRAVQEMLESTRLQTPEALASCSIAHPFAHRPLVEFLLSIPARVVCAPAEPRRLMRRAFAGLLPPMVLKRRSKASYGAIYRASLLVLAAEMLKHPAKIRLAELGCLELGSLVGRLEKFSQGIDCNEPQLRQAILMEFWLRNIEL